MSDKIKETLLFAVVEPQAATVPKPVEKKGWGAAKYVQFGEDNKYPDFLLECYENCAVLQSVINRLADYVAGSGVGNERQGEKEVNTDGLTLNDLVKKCTVDYLIFGAFAVGVRRNREHNISELDYHDPRRIRLTEDGKEVVYSKDWKSSGSKTVTLPVYKESDRSPNQAIMYVKSNTSRTIYGRPMWSAVVKDVQTAIEISTFHLSAIRNNFNGSAVVNFNNGTPDDDTRKDIEKRINEKFAGASNAGRIVVSFNDDKDHQTTIGTLPQNNFDQKYNALSKSVRENIFIAFSAQPQLLGSDPEHTGFNATEFEQAFKLFRETVVTPLQKEVERAFSRLGEEYTFKLNEFSIDFGNKGEEVING